MGFPVSRGESLAVHRPLRYPPHGGLGRIPHAWRASVPCLKRQELAGEKIRVYGVRQWKAGWRHHLTCNPRPSQRASSVSHRDAHVPRQDEKVSRRPENQAGSSTSPRARPGEDLEPGDLSESA